VRCCATTALWRRSRCKIFPKIYTKYSPQAKRACRLLEACVHGQLLALAQRPTKQEPVEAVLANVISEEPDAGHGSG
jgi:hypothetical protein